ncbi:MAG: thiamine phosphate synthase [Pseudomonadota bacterium]
MSEEMVNLPKRGLYAITPETSDLHELPRLVAPVLRGGAAVLQFRDKSLEHELRRQVAAELKHQCDEYGVTFIVNDDASLAAAIGADGVHVGKDDAALGVARSAVPDGIVGVSCYNDAWRATQAIEDGADYVAYGSFFPSLTKPGAVRASLELVRDSRDALSRPLVAIGGITVENAPGLIAAGVDFVAVINALFQAPSPEKAAQHFAALF